MLTATSPLCQTTFETPLGMMRAIAGDAGIVVCDFLDRRDMDHTLDRVERQHGKVESGEHPHLAKLVDEFNAYFEGTLRTFTVPLAPIGTEFEQRCWAYLQSIPFGETRSYGQQARELGDIKAVRAVGRANGRNFIAIMIPCHRVIAATGDLTGYGGGIERKRWLLNHEQPRGLF